MPEKTCADYITKHGGTVFLYKKDEEYGNPVSFERVMAYDAVGVFLYINQFAPGVFYPWASIKKMHLPRPMPVDLM